MKKIFYFITIFLCVFSLNIASAYARNCSQYEPSKCPAYDEEGNKCKLDHSACTIDKSGDKNNSNKEEDKIGWLDTGSNENKVSCGNVITIHKSIPRTTSLIVTIISIIAPALLAIMGAIDFYKAIMSAKDDAIAKNQKAFIARVISAIILFLVIVLTKLFVSLMANVLGTGGGSSITGCIDCFISNRCS